MVNLGIGRWRAGCFALTFARKPEGPVAEREYLQGSGLFCPATASDIQELSSLQISPLPAKCVLDPHCSILHKILKSVFSDS